MCRATQFEFLQTLVYIMAPSSSNPKVKEDKEVLNVQLLINEIRKLSFRAIPNITYKQDPSGALSMIPS